MKIATVTYLSDLALDSLSRTMTQREIADYYQTYLKGHHGPERVWQFEQLRRSDIDHTWELVYTCEIPDSEYMWQILGGHHG